MGIFRTILFFWIIIVAITTIPYQRPGQPVGEFRRIKSPNPGPAVQEGSGRAFYGFTIPSSIYHGTSILSVIDCLERSRSLVPIGNYIYFTPVTWRALAEAKDTYPGLDNRQLIVLEFDTGRLGDEKISLVKWGANMGEMGMYTADNRVPFRALTDRCKIELLDKLRNYDLTKNIFSYPETPETRSTKNRLAVSLGFKDWQELNQRLGLHLP